MGENYALKNFKAFYIHYKHFNLDQIRPNRETDIDRENQGWLYTLMVDIESEKLRILEGTPHSSHQSKMWKLPGKNWELFP
jgi:hypothetical protein